MVILLFKVIIAGFLILNKKAFMWLMPIGLEYIKSIDFQIIYNLDQIEEVKNETTNILFSSCYIK